MAGPRLAFLQLLAMAGLLCGAGLAAEAGTPPAEAAEREGGPSEASGAIATGLRAVLVQPAELHLNVDELERDVFRLRVVDSLLADPLAAPGFLEDLARARFGPAATSAWGAWRESAALLDARRPALQPFTARPVWGDDSAPGVPRPLWKSLGRAPDGARALAAILARTDEARRRAFDALTPDERRLLEERAPELLRQEEDDLTLGVLEFRRREKAKEAFADSVLAVCRAIDRDRLLEMGSIVEIADRAVRGEPPFEAPGAAWRGGERAAPRALRGRVEGRIRFAAPSPWGWIVFGGASANRYRGAFAAIVDPGGDDEYDLARVWEGESCAVQVVADLAGDDRYRSLGAGTLGAGLAGAGLLYDGAGDDLYEGGLVSLGAGFLGVGVLWDRAGRDRYLAGAACEGMGFLGIGRLRDDAGDDLYQATLHAQGFGYVAGLGALEDSAGNDLYVVQPEVTAVLHYNDRSYSLSQGVSFGERPHHSGGIGLLLDAGGNDGYVADLFAQGTAYWFGIGGLWDHDGHDNYTAYQYAQGSGVHRAVGLLLDDAGNDTYQSKGVSQGVGHDLGLGVLRDLLGNDAYTSTDLSQGAGNANGIGILLDASGLDGYFGKSDRNVLGFGDYRREFESVGLAIDLLGRDVRAPRGAEDSLWLGGTVGAGIDFPGDVPAEKVWADTFKIPVAGGSYSDEELFLMAASGEPRFSEWQKMGVDSLAARGRGAIPFLVTRLGTENARERQTLKDIIKRMEDAGVLDLLEVAQWRDDRELALAIWIAGEAAAPVAVVPLEACLHRDSSSGSLSSRGRTSEPSRPSDEIAAAAMTALGKICMAMPEGKSLDPEFSRSLAARGADALRDGLASSDREVLAKAAAFLLGALRSDESIAPLIDGLAAPRPMVRTACRLALARHGAAVPRAFSAGSGPRPTSGSRATDARRTLLALPSDPIARANLILLAAEGARADVERRAWEPLLPRLVDGIDLTNESVAVAAARLVRAWNEESKGRSRPALAQLAARLRGSSALGASLLR